VILAKEGKGMNLYKGRKVEESSELLAILEENSERRHNCDW
jgi:hypothetical protein